MRIEFHIIGKEGENVIVKDVQPSEAVKTLKILMEEHSAKEGFFRKERR